MSIAHLSYVVCNECGKTAEPKDNADAARATASAQGFSHIRDVANGHRDLCAACHDRYHMPDGEVPPSEMGPPLLTAKQLAERWDTSPSVIYRLVRERRIHSVRLGPRTVRIPLGAVAAYEREGGFS